MDILMNGVSMAPPNLPKCEEDALLPTCDTFGEEGGG